MESKIIQISCAVDEQGAFIVALCEDGSVWTSDGRSSFQVFEEPFKAAQKNEEAPETIDNTGSPKLLDDMESFAQACNRAGNSKDARKVRSWVKQLRASA